MKKNNKNNALLICEIIMLAAEFTEKKIANVFVDFAGHVNNIRIAAHKVDTIYSKRTDDDEIFSITADLDDKNARKLLISAIKSLEAIEAEGIERVKILSRVFHPIQSK